MQIRSRVTAAVLCSSQIERTRLVALHSDVKIFIAVATQSKLIFRTGTRHVKIVHMTITMYTSDLSQAGLRRPPGTDRTGSIPDNTDFFGH